jgi:hypothetical protein
MGIDYKLLARIRVDIPTYYAFIVEKLNAVKADSLPCEIELEYLEKTKRELGEYLNSNKEA